MIAPIPQDRPSAQQVLSHPWLGGYMATQEEVAKNFSDNQQKLQVSEEKAQLGCAPMVLRKSRTGLPKFWNETWPDVEDLPKYSYADRVKKRVHKMPLTTFITKKEPKYVLGAIKQYLQKLEIKMTPC